MALLIVMLVIPLAIDAQIEVHDNGKVTIGSKPANPANRYWAHTFLNGQADGNTFPNVTVTVKKRNYLGPFQI